MHNAIISTMLACLTTTFLATAASGQVLGPPQVRTASITVVVDSTLPFDKPVLVVRRQGLTPNNVIVVRNANIAPNSFAGALHSIRMLMLRDGVRPSQSTRMSPAFTPLTAAPSIDALVGSLSLLTSAATRAVPGFSDGKAIDIEIPLADARFLDKGLSRRTGRPVPPE